MNDAQGAITQSILDMGDRLRPVFAELMGDVKEALDSAPIQWFITNIAEVVKWVARAGETWVIYKGIMTGVEFITKTFTLDEGILTVSMGEFTAMTDGATLAVEGLESVMATLGVGVLAIGIGEIVNQFIEWNKQIDDTVEGITHLKNLTKKTDELGKSFNDDVTNFKEFRLGLFDPSMASDAYEKVIRDGKEGYKQLLDIQVQMATAKEKYVALGDPQIHYYTASDGFSYKATDEGYDEKQELGEQISKLSGEANQLRSQNNALAMQKFYYNARGIKSSFNPLFDKQDTAINHTRETQKAEGNKALTINIKINDLVKELNLHSTTIQGGAKQIKDIITEVLLSAVNDSQQIAHD